MTLLELVDRRILSAVEFVDATTGQRVRDPLTISVPDGVRVIRNHSAIYVVRAAPNLTAFTETFEPTPAMPPTSTIALLVSDPSRRYLPRAFGLDIPRDPANAAPSPANSLFQPVTVRLYRSPAAHPAADWATVRAHITRGGADVAGAIVRVIRKSDTTRIGVGLSDDRGEALVNVPGIPLVNWDGGNGPVLASQIDVKIETVVDPKAATPPDPDGFDQAAASSSVDAKLGAGDELTITLTIPTS